MLAAIRVFAQSWVARLLMGLLMVAFVFFGVRTGLQTPMHASNAVIVAGPRKITPTDFKRAWDNFKRGAEQQSGQPISLEVAAENHLDRRLLEGLATQEALAAVITGMGVKPSDKLMAEEIQKIPAFFDPVTGRFDKAQFQRKLAENGISPPQFDRILADQIAQSHMASALTSGVRVPRAYAALVAIYGLENRDFGYFPLGPQNVPPLAPPTDAQLTQFMKENAAQLTRPEFRVLTLVRFSPTLVSANLPIDEAELKKRFDFRKDTQSKPELRSLVQIPAKDAAAATQIAARLGKGESPEAIAKTFGVDAIVYADKPKAAIADRLVADAAFALPVGQVSGPIKGDLGLAVVKVTKATPGHTATLEELRPQLEAEMRKEAAGEKVYALSQAYDDAHAKGASLAEAAQKAGVPLITLPPISKQGVLPNGQPAQGLPPKVLETAFNLPQGGESEVEDLGGGEYFAVKVEKVIAPAVPALAEVKPDLTRYWMSREMMKRLQARADELTARLRKGESLEAVAAAAGSSLTRAVGLDRATAGQNKTLSQDALIKVFGAKPGDPIVAEGTTFGLVVGKLEAVRTGEGAKLAQLTEAARPQMSQTAARELLESASIAASAELKRAGKLKTNPALARSAIGMEPETADGKAGKAK
jgi:peptidyl-prolyl cis-trans isomerase D